MSKEDLDINKFSKEMTKTEFMNWYEDYAMLECPKSFGLGDSVFSNNLCNKHSGNCLDCMEESIKDIKFLD